MSSSSLAKAFALSFAVSFVARTASAQETPNPKIGQAFAIDRFSPSVRGSEWFANESLDLRGHLRPALGIVSDFAYLPLVVFNADGSTYRAVVRDREVVHLGGALTLWSRVRLSLDLPIPLYASGSAAVVQGVIYSAPARTTTIGDLRVGADVRVLGEYGSVATLAAGVLVDVPSGDVDSYASDGRVRVGPRILFAGDAGAWTYSARFGLDVRARSESLTDTAIGTAFAFAGALGIRVADDALVVGPEVFGSTLLGGSGVAAATAPVEALFGFHYSLNNARFGVGAGAGLTPSLGNPTARILGSLEWAPSVPRRVVIPSGPIAPMEPCPEGSVRRAGACVATQPSDEDADGIADKYDACREVAGVVDDDPMKNGCPADRDGDGVPDASDACVGVRGVRSEDPKKNGCPPDRDGDAVEDANDACVDQAGIATIDPKTNGCPDPDRDRDGIANDADACPDDPGVPSAEGKKNGCPKAAIKGDTIRLLDPITFKIGTAALATSAENQAVLDAVLKILAEHPNLRRIRVEGHTDDRGVTAKNRKLSADRAGAVVKWLLVHGIEASRLSPVGYGPDRPMDTNETEAGRQNNRRIEFRILD